MYERLGGEKLNILSNEECKKTSKILVESMESEFMPESEEHFDHVNFVEANTLLEEIADVTKKHFIRRHKINKKKEDILDNILDNAAWMAEHGEEDDFTPSVMNWIINQPIEVVYAYNCVLEIRKSLYILKKAKNLNTPKYENLSRTEIIAILSKKAENDFEQIRLKGELGKLDDKKLNEFYNYYMKHDEGIYAIIRNLERQNNNMQEQKNIIKEIVRDVIDDIYLEIDIDKYFHIIQTKNMSNSSVNESLKELVLWHGKNDDGGQIDNEVVEKDKKECKGILKDLGFKEEECEFRTNRYSDSLPADIEIYSIALRNINNTLRCAFENVVEKELSKSKNKDFAFKDKFLEYLTFKKKLNDLNLAVCELKLILDNENLQKDDVLFKIFQYKKVDIAKKHISLMVELKGKQLSPIKSNPRTAQSGRLDLFCFNYIMTEEEKEIIKLNSQSIKLGSYHEAVPQAFERMQELFGSLK